MNRRHFLNSFAAAASAMVLDPERLLWVPGKKSFSIPKAAVELCDGFEIWHIRTSEQAARAVASRLKGYGVYDAEMHGTKIWLATPIPEGDTIAVDAPGGWWMGGE